MGKDCKTLLKLRSQFPVWQFLHDTSVSGGSSLYIAGYQISLLAYIKSQVSLNCDLTLLQFQLSKLHQRK